MEPGRDEKKEEPKEKQPKQIGMWVMGRWNLVGGKKKLREFGVGEKKKGMEKLKVRGNCNCLLEVGK